MVERDILTFLLSQDSLSHLVGSRIYPIHLPNDPTLPAIIFFMVSSTHAHHLRGALGHVLVRTQFDVFSDTFQKMEETAETLRQILEGYNGSVGSQTCVSCKLQNQTSFGERPQDASDNWTYRRSLDFMFRFVETVPTFVTGGCLLSGQAQISVTPA